MKVCIECGGEVVYSPVPTCSNCGLIVSDYDDVGNDVYVAGNKGDLVFGSVKNDDRAPLEILRTSELNTNSKDIVESGIISPMTWRHLIRGEDRCIYQIINMIKTSTYIRDESIPFLKNEIVMILKEIAGKRVHAKIVAWVWLMQHNITPGFTISRTTESKLRKKFGIPSKSCLPKTSDICLKLSQNPQIIEFTETLSKNDIKCTSELVASLFVRPRDLYRGENSRRLALSKKLREKGIELPEIL